MTKHSYVGDTGPAVRARFFDNALDSDRRRMDESNETVANIEVTVSVMTETLEAQELQIQKQAE